MRLFVQQGENMRAAAAVRVARAAALLAVFVGMAAAQEVDDAAVAETMHTIAIIVNPANGGAVSRNPNQMYYAAGTNVNIMAAPAIGYKFIGWSGDVADTANPLTVTMDANKTLTANFQYILKTYTLTTRTYPSDGGSVTRNPDKEEYAAGEEVTLMATPEPGYSFTGWTGVVAGRSNRLTVTMDGEKTVTANFYKQSMSAARKPAARKPDSESAARKPSTPKPEKEEKHTKWGLGAHWGADFSMSMKDGGEIMYPPGEDRAFDLGHFPGFEISIPEIPDLPDDAQDSLEIPEIPSLKISVPYIKIGRSDWKSSALNIGGKIFIDVVPHIETIELSGNLGVWQYRCDASYLDVEQSDSMMTLIMDGERGGEEGYPFPYKNIPLALSDYNISFLGLTETPYAKLQFDLSARRTVLDLGRVKFNAGVGFSVHFATPILSGGLIEAVEKDKGIKTAEDLVDAFMGTGDVTLSGEDILNKIISEFFTPRFGAHIVAGGRLKLSSMVGIYVDGKFLIPLSKYDENQQVKPMGMLLNTGLSLSF